MDRPSLDVYAAVLRHTVLAEGFGGTADGPDLQVPLERVVVVREIDHGEGGTLPDFLVNRLTGLDSATLADFNAPRERVRVLGSLPGIGPHEVVPMDSITRILEGRWQAFYREFPISSGIVSFSHVGFGPDGDRALVYMEHIRHGASGEGTAYVLERRDGRWAVLDEHRLMDV